MKIEIPSEANNAVAAFFNSPDIALTFGLSSLNFTVTAIYLQHPEDAGIQERIAGFVSPGHRFHAWVRRYDNAMTVERRLELLGLYLDYFHEAQPLDQPLTSDYLEIDEFLDAAVGEDSDPEPTTSEPELPAQIINNLDESALEGFVPPEPEPSRTIRIQKTLAISWDELTGFERNPVSWCELLPGVEFLLDAVVDDDGTLVGYDGYIRESETGELLADFPQVNLGESVYKTWERPITHGNNVYLVQVKVIDPTAEAPFD